MQAQVEGLALRVADNKTGYFGVYFDKPGRPKPFKAEVKRRGGKTVSLGCFATAEEAALCVARTPEGRAVVPEKAVAPPPMTGEEVRQQAQAEGLALLVADNKTGFFAVGYLPGRTKPYQAKVTRDPAKQVHLRSFATAEEAALCVARSPEGQAAAAKAAAPPPPSPLTSEQARQQAQAEGLTLLRVAGTKTGYACVFHNNPSQPKPYQAQVRYGGKLASLGSFVTAEEAALCVARSPEGQALGQAMAKRARVALTSEPAVSAPAFTVAATATTAAAALAASVERAERARWGVAATFARTTAALQQARDAAIGTIALDIIYEAAGAAANELSAEVAAEVMAGIAMGL